MWDSYRKRIDYFEEYMANGPSWFVERNGKRMALLSDRTMADTFWYSYRVEPLSDDEGERQEVMSADFWDPDRAIAEKYVFVNCDTGQRRGEFVLLGGRNSFGNGRVTVRGLGGDTKYKLQPWDGVVLWIRRALGISKRPRRFRC